MAAKVAALKTVLEEAPVLTGMSGHLQLHLSQAMLSLARVVFALETQVPRPESMGFQAERSEMWIVTSNSPP